jgi:hypothetical protein
MEMPEIAMSGQEQQENAKRIASEESAPLFPINDWTLRLKDEKGLKGTLCLDGEDVILVENIGQPIFQMKPITGDFSVLHYFAACTKSWLASLKRGEMDIADAVETWLHFKAFKKSLAFPLPTSSTSLFPKQRP